MNTDTSKLFAMISGQNRNDFDEKSISTEIRNKIDDAIESIFIGKSTLIWIKGGKLLDAWNTALDNLREEMFAIPNSGPVVTYLRMAVFNHRAKWNIKITQSNERNTVANINDESEKQEIINNAKTMIETGTATIKQILQSSVGTQQRIQSNAKKIERAMVYQNEREHGRERARAK